MNFAEHQIERDKVKMNNNRAILRIIQIYLFT